MKNIFTLVASICICNSTFSQEGKVYPKNTAIKLGAENTYVYEVPKGITIPNNTIAKVIHDYYKKLKMPLLKNGNKYEFKVKIPDTISEFKVAFFDLNDSLIDNNKMKGYTIITRKQTKADIEKETISKLKMFYYYKYNLNTEAKEAEMVAEYEKLFKSNPKLKDTYYIQYLRFKNEVEPQTAEPLINEQITKLLNKEDEKSLKNLVILYGLSKQTSKAEETKKLIIEKYPSGDMAKNEFYKIFMEEKPKHDEAYLLNKVEEYKSKFPDSTKDSQMRYVLSSIYTELLAIYIKNKDVSNIEKYGKLVEKRELISQYNERAWELSGKDIKTECKKEDLEYGEELSRKSLAIIADMKKNLEYGQLESDFKWQYEMCLDTHALLLYKLGRVEESFAEQDELYKAKAMDVAALERYAVICEKVKGAEYAKTFIESELKKGTDSRVLINHLEEIYKKLNLPKEDFEKIKTTSVEQVNKKKQAELIKTFGSVKAIDFTLTNLEGKEVKLSSFEGKKMVVLDFWATWCGPCRASFPKMQELVTKFKDKNVEFLFVNVWERDKKEELLNKVTKFIADNKYSFHVVMDYENKVVKQYKIQGVPTKIVIDKAGNMISINPSVENIETLINDGL